MRLKNEKWNGRDLAYRVDNERQNIEVWGDPRSVRDYLDELTIVLSSEDWLTGVYSHYYDRIEQDASYQSSPFNQINFTPFTRIYYRPGSLDILPWASKPAPAYKFFSVLEQHRLAWYRVLKKFQE